MNYELAKQLKDAGYKQKNVGMFVYKNDKGHIGEIAGGRYFNNEDIKEEDVYYQPTLSELIEACGDGFYILRKLSTGFVAEDAAYDKTLGQGKTPEEAVAKLWLKLDEKEENNILGR